MSRKVKSIIFDWSGTLSDDINVVYLATMHVFRSVGLAEIELEEFKREVDYPFMKFYHKYDPTLTKEQLDPFFTEAIHRVGEPNIFPGAREVVTNLHAQGVEMVVLSGVPQSKIVIEAEAYGLHGCFKEINGSVYDKTKEIFSVLERNNLSAEHTLYVGDMVHDIESAQHASVKSVAITWGYHGRDRLSEM